MKRIFFIDLDGTLFYPKSRKGLVNEANLAFLNLVHAQGDRICFVTSRTLATHEKLEDKLGFSCDYIGGDGTSVTVDGRTIYKKGFDPKSILNCLDYVINTVGSSLTLLASFDYESILSKKHSTWGSRMGYYIFQRYLGKAALASVTDDELFLSQINEGQGNRVMALIGITRKKKEKAETLTKELNDKFPDLSFTCIGEFIDITPKGCSKATGASLYLEYLGGLKDNIIVVGDSGNDVPLFEAYPSNSYCMDHAPEAVKKKALHLVKAVADLGPIIYGETK